MKLGNMILQRVREMPPSGIRKYFDLVNDMEDVISLGVGEPDFITPWHVREAGIYSLEEGSTHYTSNSGMPELREAISDYLDRKFNLKYNAEEEILVTVGGSEGIDLALRSLVGPGDEVIIPEPSFVAYQGCTAFTGAVPVVIDLKAENEFKLTKQELEEAITDKTKVLIMPFPNNPTGATMNKEELSEIVEVLKDKDIVVISDEIYAELSYEANHISIAAFPEMRDKTVVINGFSKSHAMTGWRLGYACGNSVIIDAMKKIHQYAIMCCPTTSQFAAIEALRSGDEVVKEMVTAYNQRRRVLLDGFEKIGLECFEPQGAFYLFPSIKSTGMTSDEFCEKLLKEEEVLVIPGTAFGKSGEGFIRCSYASSMENILESIKRIDNFIKNI